MRPLVIVLDPVLRGQDLRLGQGGELLAPKELVLQATVETLDVGILPRAARLDVERPYAGGGQPRPDRIRDELRSVVATDECRLSMHAEQVLECGDHIVCRDAALHLERMTLSRVLVDDGKELEPAAIRGLVHGEVVAPDVVPALGP